MMARLILMAWMLVYAVPNYAFTCYATLIKDSCWLPYEVTIHIIDVQQRQEMTSVKADKGQSWARVKFDCEPGLKMLYKAEYKPVFWQSEVGRSYFAKNYWSLPMTVDKDTSAWEVQIFYPRNFSEIPFPPDAVGNCKYNLQAIPVIPKAKAIQQK